jgi:hypothetical protein
MYVVIDRRNRAVPPERCSVLSRHRTAAAAFAAIRKEGDSLRRLPGCRYYRPEYNREVYRLDGGKLGAQVAPCPDCGQTDGHSNGCHAA